jgi:hypothetical protein
MQPEAFVKATYLSLTTFRRDGRAVANAVWFVPDGDRLLVVTGATSGKVKRLRNDPRVLVAPSDMRGRPSAAPVEARAVVLDGAGTADALAAIRKRYGFQARLFFRGGSVGLVGLAIDLDGRPDA